MAFPAALLIVPAILVVRGVYEAPWLSTDRQSVLLAAVDSEGCMIGWGAVRDAEGYAAESIRLAALLDEKDPLPTNGGVSEPALQLVR